jgi:hypothetical protein
VCKRSHEGRERDIEERRNGSDIPLRMRRELTVVFAVVNKVDLTKMENSSNNGDEILRQAERMKGERWSDDTWRERGGVGWSTIEKRHERHMIDLIHNEK